jgi:hypothetical protein
MRTPTWHGHGHGHVHPHLARTRSRSCARPPAGHACPPAQVFIPELGATYRCHPSFRLFGAQNPVQEGGGRKGLPRSFLNRFSRVAVEVLGAGDLRAIASALFPRLPAGRLCGWACVCVCEWGRIKQQGLKSEKQHELSCRGLGK